MPIQYKEEWVVKVGKEKFILDGNQIGILREAMKAGERWVSFKKFILSVPHIECIYLLNREIVNKLPAGENIAKPITHKNWKKIKKDIYDKIGA